MCLVKPVNPIFLFIGISFPFTKCSIQTWIVSPTISWLSSVFGPSNFGIRTMQSFLSIFFKSSTVHGWIFAVFVPLSGIIRSWYSLLSLLELVDRLATLICISAVLMLGRGRKREHVKRTAKAAINDIGHPSTCGSRWSAEQRDTDHLLSDLSIAGPLIIPVVNLVFVLYYHQKICFWKCWSDFWKSQPTANSWYLTIQNYTISHLYQLLATNYLGKAGGRGVRTIRTPTRTWDFRRWKPFIATSIDLTRL